MDDGEECQREEPREAERRSAAAQRKLDPTTATLLTHQCDQIGQFIGLWATF